MQQPQPNSSACRNREPHALGMLAFDVRAARVPLMKDQQIDDWQSLLARVGSHQDREAFAALFDYFAPRVKSQMMRSGATASAAEELVQETFITVWRKAGTYDPAKASAAAWIFTVARNKRIDKYRKEARPEPDMNDPAFVPDDEPDGFSTVHKHQRAERIRKALNTLPEAQRQVLLKSYYSEETHAEIASSLRLPIGTVKSRIRLALEKLRDLLGEDIKDELS
jgi:RNA polymerase sigma-70 factor (ECF subfamily)